MFLGTHTNKLDKKGRISLPATFRTFLGREFVLTISQINPCLEGFSVDRMQKISRQIDRKDMFSQEHSSLALSIFSNSELVLCDKEGRCVLNSQFCNQARLELNTHVVCVGLGATFQIWNQKSFSEAKKCAEEHIKNCNPELLIND